ncbi:LysR family transcriptional regulator [Achromobacter aloeverae]|uniref:LysR family transcriptional regulator n=1 Tax=Achromobacter aloeverae TaxID=1750518 RepID=A0A4Q1HFD8_9BURK|nr:LysR family transcriptional regulator [Achromobacter aloeverae]RXN85268.1 LysR family transcriptional regulator [Achromobacter aloeverae]
MDLRRLRYFLVVAEELHFTRAAQRIGIAQPPLTYQIKMLERELGVSLFDRQPGHIRLTEAGMVLREDARDILDRVTQAATRCQRSAQGLIGRIGVGFTESASFCAEVTTALHRYRDRYPQVEMSLEENRSMPLVQSLRQGRIDVAFVRLPIGMDADVRFKLISTEPMVVALPRTHRLARRKSLRLHELHDEPFLLYPRATRFGLSDMIVTACEARGFSPRVVQQAPQISSTINLVASSLGITIVPACMQQSRIDQVRYVPLKEDDLSASLGVAYRSGPLPPAVANLLAMVPARA